jgi:hypothetical protein
MLPSKIKSRHSSVREKESHEINHYRTEYFLQIQKAKYICVEDSIERDFIIKNNQRKFEL